MPAELAFSSPELLWGIYVRLLGACYFVAFWPLHREILALAGSRGVAPVLPQLRRIQKDLPLRRFIYFPTLLWLGATDRALRLLVAAGSCASLAVVAGLPGERIALAACFILYLSLDIAVDLFYPWDCLLLEAGFIALFLPGLRALPSLAAVAAPAPALALACRFLLFRVVFGFGKYKFFGPGRLDWTYLKSFLIGQPMPTRIGWYAARLPNFLLRPALAAMFLVEVPLPFLLFFPEPLPRVAAAGIALLMATIWLTGNFGFFNPLVLALCLPVFAPSLIQISSPASWPSLVLLHARSFPVATIVTLSLAGLGLVYLPFNSWCTRAWLYWPSIAGARFAPARALLAVVRALSPLRLVHAYGVFGPQSGPPVKWVPIIEGRRDGTAWREYRYRCMPSDERSAPRFIAPFHPRLDHLTLYEAYGLGTSSFLASTFSQGNPYRFSRASFLERLLQRLLEGGSPAVDLFAEDPFLDGPPTEIRVRLCMYRPADGEARARGQWWARSDVGTHLPSVRLDPTVWSDWLPDPELFHLDDRVWRHRMPSLRALHSLGPARAADAPALTWQEVAGDGVEPLDVALFWHDLLPFIIDSADGAPSLERLPAVVERLHARYGDGQLRAFERVQARLAIVLAARLEPHFLGRAEPRIALESYLHFGLLVRRIIGQGQAAFDEALRDPAAAARRANELTVADGLFHLAIFWHRTLEFHARKERLLRQMLGDAVQKPADVLPGFFKVMPLLAAQRPASTVEEKLPRFSRTDGGGWLIEEALP